ncbi:hypothetical protein [Novilysobacter spongiicola]|uniref:Uncharacterized protein n=1 Tax=Lysobacter spongiicola DSM 21749 TaxID=1122188 RepID=A0A1T4PFB8_9GAMM|nr:hypothetical protein [Lysobacter spongiicola]SJZ90027.1 hypothetical protein SAMN02745674_01157 [Lysobacter spongiicola DSM 21749]
MRVPDWLVVRRPWLAGLVGGAVLGLAFGLLRPVPRATAEDIAGPAWQLPDPDVLVRADESGFSKLRNARFWGGNGSMNGGPGSKRVEWRLTGIIADPVPTALVLATGDPKTVSLHVGDSLPGGGEIVGISADAVEYQRDGCLQSRILYAPAQPVGGDPCASKP